MASQFFPVYIDHAMTEIEELIPLLNNKTISFSQLKYISRLFRHIGILRLLETDETAQSVVWFQRSAAAFDFGMEYIDRQDARLSQCEAFYDAIIGQDKGLAKSFSKLRSISFKPDYEYEEDYLFFKVLIGIVASDPDDLKSTLRRYEILVKHDNEPRLGIVTALINLDSDLFAESFADLLGLREDLIKRHRENETLPPESLATEGNFYSEGAALLILAETAGLKVDSEYKFIPSTIRLPVHIVMSKSSWRTID